MNPDGTGLFPVFFRWPSEGDRLRSAKPQRQRKPLWRRDQRLRWSGARSAAAAQLEAAEAGQYNFVLVFVLRVDIFAETVFFAGLARAGKFRE
jgi:hypothetical protein